MWLRVYKGGPLGPLSHEPKFKQDVKTRSKHSGEDVIYGMGGLNEDVVRMYIRIYKIHA